MLLNIEGRAAPAAWQLGSGVVAGSGSSKYTASQPSSLDWVQDEAGFSSEARLSSVLAAIWSPSNAGRADHCQADGIGGAKLGGGRRETLGLTSVGSGIGRPIIDAALRMAPCRQRERSRIRNLVQDAIQKGQCVAMVGALFEKSCARMCSTRRPGWPDPLPGSAAGLALSRRSGPTTGWRQSRFQSNLPAAE